MKLQDPLLAKHIKIRKKYNKKEKLRRVLQERFINQKNRIKEFIGRF